MVTGPAQAAVSFSNRGITAFYEGVLWKKRWISLFKHTISRLVVLGEN
jgi:hypothetical protein